MKGHFSPEYLVTLHSPGLIEPLVWVLCYLSLEMDHKEITVLLRKMRQVGRKRQTEGKNSGGAEIETLLWTPLPVRPLLQHITPSRKGHFTVWGWLEGIFRPNPVSPANLDISRDGSSLPRVGSMLLQNGPEYTILCISTVWSCQWLGWYFLRMISMFSLALAKSLCGREFFMLCALSMLKCEQSRYISHWQLTLCGLCQHKIHGMQ